MADQNPLPEDAGGGFLSGEIMGIPTWMFLGGVGVVVVFLYLRKKNSSSGNSALAGPIGGQVTPQTAGGAVDPYTGQLIDPFTGQPYTAVGTNTPQQSDLSTWITAAEKALTGAGYQPGAIAGAIYDYTQGNQLTGPEAGIINAALGRVGYPPVALPFLGTVPTPPKPIIHPPPKPHLPVPTGSGNGTKLGPLASLPAQLLSHLQHNEHILGSVRLPSAGPNAGYYFSNLGGVFAVGGAPFHGSYFSLPAATRNIPNRTFTGLQLLPGGGYRLTSSTGEKYAFPAKPVAKAS